MDIRDRVLLVRQLKGAPATILLLMMGIGRPTGRDELVLLTTYSEHTVQKALNQLEFLGLAQNHGRYNGWALTALAQQHFLPADAPIDEDRDVQSLPLPDTAREALPGPEVQTSHLDSDPPDPLSPQGQKAHLQPDAAPREVQTPHLPSSSSSSPSPKLDKPKRLQTSETTTTTAGGEKCTSPEQPVWGPDAEQAVALLRRWGPPESLARKCVTMALEGGWSDTVVLENVDGWLKYAATEAGKTINNPGFHTIKRISLLDPAPDIPEPQQDSPDDVTRAYLAEHYANIVHTL